MPDEDLIEEPEGGADVTIHARSVADVGKQRRAGALRKVKAAGAAEPEQQARATPPANRSTRPVTEG